jgi:hypothetical protein
MENELQEDPAVRIPSIETRQLNCDSAVTLTLERLQ